MKNLLLATGLFVLSCSPFAGMVADRADQTAAENSLEGIWLGKVMVTEEGLRMAFEVTRDQDGTLTATMSVIDQDAFGIPVAAIGFDSKNVRFDISAINCVYEGMMPDNSTIVGAIRQGDSDPDDLILRRVDQLPVTAPKRPQEPEKPYPYKEEEVTYGNKKDGVTLAGTLTLPQTGGPHPAVLLIPGSGPNDRDETIWGHRVFLVLADHLTRQGIAVLRADDRGVGESTGDFSAATIADLARDACVGVEYLKTRPEIDAGKIGLVGHSLGASVAPLAATQSPDVAFIVLMAGASNTLAEGIHNQCQLIYRSAGASEAAIALNQAINEEIITVIKNEPDDPAAEEKIRDVLERFNPEVAKLSEEDKRMVELSDPLDFASYRGFLSPAMRFDLFYDTRESLCKVSCPVLAINGDKDIQVLSQVSLKGIEEALKAGGNPDYTVKELPGLNHLFQTAATGAIDEYSKIEETISPSALVLISGWIKEQTRID